MSIIKRFNKFYESTDNSEFKVDGTNIGYPIEIPTDSTKEVVKIEDLIGKTIINLAYTNDTLVLECLPEDKKSRVYYSFVHEQDCCELVWLDDIVGDLEDLLDSPILKAEEKISSEDNDDAPILNSSDDSHTWTFYTLANKNGYVDFRWFGTSNGYYSESVTISKFIRN